MSLVLFPVRPKFAALAILLLLAFAGLLGGVARGDVLYREAFGTATTGGQGAAQGYDWAIHSGATATDKSASVDTVAAINRTASASKPGTGDAIGNVNAGPVIGATPTAYGAGIAFAATGAGTVIFWTPEYPTTSSTGLGINADAYSNLKFSWYQGNADTTGNWRLAVKVGGQWYASQQFFTNTTGVANAANFALGGDDGNGGANHGSELRSFVYSTNASAWFLLNFDGAFTLGGTPGTGTGASGSVLSLGAQPASNLSGSIDAFGIFSEVIGGGNRRFDSFMIEGTLVSTAVAIVASNQTVSLLFNTSTNIALMASNTNNTFLTFYITNGPANGALGTLNSNLVTYTPNPNYVGADSISFYASDGVFTSAVATVSLAVTNTEVLYPPSPQITKDGTAIVLTNYASLPLSTRTLTTYPPVMNFGDQLARVNFLRCEPTNAPLATGRVFLCDNNRNLYILDKTNKTFTAYINFEEVFPKFDDDPGFAGGLVTFQFDPEYATNGKFYTVHTENPSVAGSAVPTNGSLTGLDVTGYTTTTAVNPPLGSVTRQAVLVEWTDTNVNNATFEGTAREILRVGFTSNIHPMGDLLYNPLAHPGDSDYRNLYISDGDGGAGESASTRAVPQRLDAIEGKILRITPDLNLRLTDELSPNGRYRIPTSGSDTNPFVAVTLTGLRKEIFAYGFRNCHRITWDPVSNLLIEDDIGLHSWEEVNIIHKGANYGYSEREGTEQLFVGGANNGLTGSQVGATFPSSDLLTVTGLPAPVTPNYPVAMYSHKDGDAISSGFVYRGKLMPQLYGKYIFGEITTGRIFYCDLADMIANDDGVRTTLATVHELQIVFNGQARRLFDIISNEYKAKGGTSGQALPGSATATTHNDIDGVPYGSGRADIRLGMDSDGELYVLSKSDGMIRRMVSVVVPPTISSIATTNGTVALTWSSISNRVYRVQYKNSLADIGWTDLPGDVTATNGFATKVDALGTTNRFYRLMLP